MLYLTLATFSVEKNVPERRKYGMSDRNVSESKKQKAEDFQPTKKWHTKPSAPKGKQRSKLKHYRWRSTSKCLSSLELTLSHLDKKVSSLLKLAQVASQHVREKHVTIFHIYISGWA